MGNDTDTYKIIRFRQNAHNKTIRTRLTLEEAQRHCKDPNTRKEGVYFDGYTKE